MQQDGNTSGMTDRERWEQTAVHKASSYSCGKCGKPFGSPHDLYAHLDREHPQPAREVGR